jgi:hypothetical protein
LNSFKSVFQVRLISGAGSSLRMSLVLNINGSIKLWYDERLLERGHCRLEGLRIDNGFVVCGLGWEALVLDGVTLELLKARFACCV